MADVILQKEHADMYFWRNFVDIVFGQVQSEMVRLMFMYCIVCI
jgi:hypothetical protein